VARPASQHPTEGELAILRILWQKGALTVADISRELSAKRYQSVRVRLDIMLQKGLVRLVVKQRPQQYEAAVTEKATKKRLVRGLIRGIFGGSAKALVIYALDERATQDEVSEIRKRVDELGRST
jgi:predicted transcriptional regulator